MTLEQALDWIYARQQFGIKLGLGNIRRIAAALGDPQQAFRAVHVAGTNGKGSVCAMTEAILRKAGFRTGLFVSPHLVDFRERMLVDGAMPSRGAVAECVSEVRRVTETLGITPTFFEAATAAAFLLFAHRKIDVGVVETGMGGRLDSTNILVPAVCGLTPIATDHARWLGSTLREIAGEKAGIFKRGVPAFSVPQSADVADELRKKAAAATATPLEFLTEDSELQPSLAGAYQKQNATLAARLARAVEPAIEPGVIADALASVSWPGRFQRLGGIVLDGAHNVHAIECLVRTWREQFGDKRARVIFGAMEDKDAVPMLGVLNAIASEFVFVPVRSPRTRSPEALRECAGGGTVCSSVSEALAAAGSQGGMTLVTGSLFLVGEALAVLQGGKPARIGTQ